MGMFFSNTNVRATNAIEAMQAIDRLNHEYDDEMEIEWDSSYVYAPHRADGLRVIQDGKVFTFAGEIDPELADFNAAYEWVTEDIGFGSARNLIVEEKPGIWAVHYWYHD